MEENFVIERIKLFMDEMHLSAYQLAKDTKVSTVAVKDYLAKGKGIGKIVYNMINAYPSLSLEWLLRGNGEMFLSGHGTNKQSEMLKEDLSVQPEYSETASKVAILNVLIEEKNKQIDRLGKEIIELNRQLAIREYQMAKAGLSDSISEPPSGEE